MGKYPPYVILHASDVFESEALFALGQALEPESKDPRDIPGYWLRVGIGEITHTTPNNKDWSGWLNANQTVTGKIMSLDWNTVGTSANPILTARGQGKTFYISKNNTPPVAQFDITEQSILRGSGPIPDLFLFSGKEIYKFIPPADVAQDAWLFTALEEMYRLDGEEGEEVAKIPNFIRENKNTINKIRSSFITNPKRLGGGADGVAFSIGPDKVLKIFRDEFAFGKAIEAIERLHKQPQFAKTEAMIYDAGILGKFNISQHRGQDIFYYIMEKMTPIKNIPGDAYIKVKRVLNYVGFIIGNDDRWFDLRRKMNDPTKHEVVKQYIRQYSQKLTDNLLSKKPDLIRTIEHKVPALKGDWLLSYVEEIIVKYITGRLDLHMGNLGVTSYGQLRYYDPSFGGIDSGINMGGGEKPQATHESNEDPFGELSYKYAPDAATPSENEE